MLTGTNEELGVKILEEAGFSAYTSMDEVVEKAVELDPATYRPKLLESYTKLADRLCLRGDLEKYIHYLELAIDLDLAQ